MAAERGYKGKVQLGQVKVAEIGRWDWTGINNPLLDSSQLGDTFDSNEYGRGNGGIITFSGWYDPDDTNGQEVLRAAAIAKTKVPTIRLYFGTGDADFFYCKGDVTCLVTQCSPVGADMAASGLCPISFTLQVSDGVLVKAVALLEADTIAFATDPPDKITDSDSGFVTAGFLAGQTVCIEGSTSNDGRAYTIAAGGVAAGTLTLTSGGSIIPEIAGDDVALIGS